MTSGTGTGGGTSTPGGSTGGSGSGQPTTNTTLTDLRVSQTFAASSAQLFRPLSTAGTPRMSFSAYGSAPSVAFDALSGSYTIDDTAPVPPPFPPSSQIGSDATFRTFQTRDGASGTFTLMLLQPGANNPRAALTYSSYGLLETVDQIQTVGAYEYRRSIVYGLPTGTSEVPTTGTATYAGTVDGYWVRRRVLDSAISGYRALRISGTQTFTVNFSTGAVTVSLTLNGTDTTTAESLGTLPLGTFTGTGTIASGNRLTGTMSGAGFTMQFSGALFGPQAAEAGISFGGEGASLPGVQQFVGGVVIGRKPS